MRVNVHGQRQRVLTTHLAAAHLRSDSSCRISSSSLCVFSAPFGHWTSRSARPSSFSCHVLKHLHTELRASASVCGLSLPFLLLLLSTPFSLPRSLPKAGSIDPCKCLNTESFPSSGRGGLPKQEPASVRSCIARLLSFNERLIVPSDLCVDPTCTFSLRL